MLNDQQISYLLRNWPYAADMATFVEARIFDPTSKLEWYLIALDPDDLNRACAIVVNDSVELVYVDLDAEIKGFAAQGKVLENDPNFRREKCMRIWTKLMKKMRGEFNATV